MINSTMNNDTSKKPADLGSSTESADAATANTARPAGDDQTLPPERLEPFGRELNPQTEDRTKELAPDDTFPGSGPSDLDRD